MTLTLISLGEKLAPSMMNLLEDEDEDDDDLNIDSRYGNSPTEIEPLVNYLCLFSSIVSLFLCLLFFYLKHKIG